jgi:hypothetical protein
VCRHADKSRNTPLKYTPLSEKICPEGRGVCLYVLNCGERVSQPERGRDSAGALPTFWRSTTTYGFEDRSFVTTLANPLRFLRNPSE